MWITIFPQSRCLTLSASNSSHGQIELLEEVRVLYFHWDWRLVFTHHPNFTSLILSWKMWKQIGNFAGLIRISGVKGADRQDVFCSYNVTISYRILPILLYLFCVMTSKQRTNADASLSWKLSQSCSDGFIYFDYRPPSECWLSPLQAVNRNRIRNRSGCVPCLILVWKAIIWVTVGSMCHNPRRSSERNVKKLSRAESLEVQKEN